MTATLLYAVAILACAISYHTLFLGHSRSLKSIPEIRPKGLKERFLISAHSRRCAVEAYRTFVNRIYRFGTFGGPVLVLPPIYFSELKEIPDSDLCFSDALEKILMTEYTHAHMSHLSYMCLKKNLGSSTAKAIPSLYRRARCALLEQLPPTEDWSPVVVFPKSPLLLASVTGDLLSATELNSDPVWVQLFVSFAENVFIGGGLIGIFPAFLRPIVKYLIPSLYHLPAEVRRVRQIVEPIIQMRLRDMELDDTEMPNDMLQWALDASVARDHVDVGEIVHCLLMTGIASIHTTSMAFTQAMYDLAAHPQCVGPLREEAEEVLSDGAEVTKQTLAKLEKLDSFLKESQRLNTPLLINARRIAAHEITLSDGFIIPAGTQTSVPVYALGMDPSLVPSSRDSSPLESFDAFRFYHARQAASGKSDAYQYATSDQTVPYWGLGRHLCCGRFFARDILKMILVGVIRDYDVKLRDGLERPASWGLDWNIVPNMSAEILMRKAR